VASVLYWRATDDLRPYALVQFLPVLLIPLVLLLYPKRGSGAVWIALAATCWPSCSRLSTADLRRARPAISGHSLKHVAAAAGMWALLAGLKSRRSAGIQPAAPIPG
jgi:hypothetical protein